MKLTKRQARYLTAISRCDWTQRNKDGTPAMRKWARVNGMIIDGRGAGAIPQTLTQKARALLANGEGQGRPAPDSLTKSNDANAGRSL
jgi:hypothetical protein